MSDDKNAVFRNAPETGRARDAYEELREWAAYDLTKMVRRHVKDKLNEVAEKHGIPRKEVAVMLMRPPIGETRKDLINFLYAVLFD